MKLRMKLLAGVAALVVALFVWANVSSPPLHGDVRVDRILVEKSQHRLILLRGGKVLKVYHVALAGASVGPKEREGDGGAPEGLYYIDSRKSDSAFHRALHVSYPDERDVKAARKHGYNPGEAIMIHGLPNGLGWLGGLHRLVDWTAGCIALTDREIEELWRAAPNGTPVEIRP
jgi:murein L,D-transpeptidase YafK